MHPKRFTLIASEHMYVDTHTYTNTHTHTHVAVPRLEYSQAMLGKTYKDTHIYTHTFTHN